MATSATVALSYGGMHTASAVEDKAAPAQSLFRPVQEMHIANTGATLLRGAKITAISPTFILVSLGWGATSLAWTVPNDPNTHYVDSHGEKIDRSALSSGDIVTITGSLVEQGTVDAQYVRLSK